LDQKTILAPAELLGHDDTRMGAISRLPLLVDRGEIADVEREESPVFRRCERELLFIRRGVFPGFFGPQNVETTATQVNGQPCDDMTIEVKPNEERFKAGRIGNGPALLWR
jgi:hypothetical protein